jgi:acyl-CoA thioester hydrolase
MDPSYKHEITVGPHLLDTNGHVNNVAYVQWLQDAAIEHARVSGCTAATTAIRATWVVRTHHIEYLKPAFAGDRIIVQTWVADFRKVRSLRKYRLIRCTDNAVLAQAETDWVLIDIATGRPRLIPDEVKRTIPAVAEIPSL